MAERFGIDTEEVAVGGRRLEAAASALALWPAQVRDVSSAGAGTPAAAAMASFGEHWGRELAVLAEEVASVSAAMTVTSGLYLDAGAEAARLFTR
jgi:hypothetical protein